MACEIFVRTSSLSAICAILMDPYREPVQRVDDALGRLKTTLAAYNTKEVPHSDRNISNWARVPSGALRPKDPQLTGDARGQTPDEMPWENPEPLFLDGDFDLTTTEIYPDVGAFCQVFLVGAEKRSDNVTFAEKRF